MGAAPRAGHQICAPSGGAGELPRRAALNQPRARGHHPDAQPVRELKTATQAQRITLLSMADYYPLIARAVAGLEKNSGENRRALYERARIALVAQLRGVVPALDESEITRERLSLEEAIRKVEAEAARQAREAVRPPAPRRTELPRREEPARRDEAPAREERRREELRGREEPPRSARGSVTPNTPASPRPARPQDAPPL